MKEAAAFCGAISHQIFTCPFQRIQQLLPCHRQKTGDVAKRVYLLAAMIRQFPCKGIVSNAAAVHHSNIYIQSHFIKQIIQCIGSKVTAVCFLHTNQSFSIFIIVIQSNLCVANDLSQLSFDLFDPGIFQYLHLCIGIQFCQIIPRQKFRFDFFRRNRHFADGIQIRTGLRQDDRIAVFIFYLLHRDRRMGMTVNKSIQPFRRSDHRSACPWNRGRVYPEMS